MKEIAPGTFREIAVVTGAGSGVGQAVVLELAKRGYGVALLGRHEATLNETIALAKPAPPARLIAFSCDIADENQVTTMAAAVRKELGDPNVLVNAAGINIARRSLMDLSVKDFQAVVAVNLTGAFLVAHAFLPGMRQAGRGTIVNIISDAGLRANPISGAAYTSAKFGLTGLTETINVEERDRGIRACAIFPGEINTPLLDKRPVPPPAEARAKMLQADDVAAAVMLAVDLPDRAVVEKLLIRPRTR
jgi:NAD(P)-dependent dehydrogenase (short-subunit alcohol dehydrogenase family)